MGSRHFSTAMLLLSVTSSAEQSPDQSICMPLCQAKGCKGEENIKVFHMTPLWLEAHASFIANERTTSAAQITFNAGSVQHAALLKVPLVAPGVLTDALPLTVEITVAHDVSIGEGAGVDSDIRYGVSDGTRFIGFETVDKWNYGDHSPCFGMEGVSGQSVTSIRRDPVTPKPSDSFYPGQYVFTLKLDERWGSCYTAHDGGFVRTTGYNNRLVLSKGLTLEVYRSDKEEKVGIRFIKVTITKDS
ncbi:uncharacterized protein LOC144665515 isoform X2 [Oculina patagonica]